MIWLHALSDLTWARSKYCNQIATKIFFFFFFLKTGDAHFPVTGHLYEILGLVMLVSHLHHMGSWWDSSFSYSGNRSFASSLHSPVTLLQWGLPADTSGSKAQLHRPGSSTGSRPGGTPAPNPLQVWKLGFWSGLLQGGTPSLDQAGQSFLIKKGERSGDAVALQTWGPPPSVMSNADALEKRENKHVIWKHDFGGTDCFLTSGPPDPY